MNHHSMQFSAMEQKQISFEESNWMDDIYVFLVAIQEQRIYSLKSMLTLVLKDRVSDKNWMLGTFVVHFSIVLLYNKVYIKQNN